MDSVRKVVKTRRMRALAVILCMLLGVASFAAAIPVPAPVAKCHGMATMSAIHHAAGHDCCPRKVETRACCPMHMGAMPVQCAPQPECCQIAEERTLPVSRESAMSSSKTHVRARTAPALFASRLSQSNLQSDLLELGLRFTRPVFDAKADLRI